LLGNSLLVRTKAGHTARVRVEHITENLCNVVTSVTHAKQRHVTAHAVRILLWRWLVHDQDWVIRYIARTIDELDVEVARTQRELERDRRGLAYR